MRVNLEWLREWVDIDAGPVELAKELTTAGLEVEAVLEAGPRLDDVVVARVVDVKAHPSAARLLICDVDDGRARHEVVCGAPNVAPGVKVPFVPVGGRLPGGQTIVAAEVRGVTSNGMLCSAKELGLSSEAGMDDGGGLMLLDDDAPLGASLSDYLRLDDAILDIDLTPNRGDCFSVLGVAREVAARHPGGMGVRPRHEHSRVEAGLDETLDVRLGAAAACPRFVGRVIRGIRVGGRSPVWMRERLRRAGLRAIHPVVDVTNYVMLELGQPLHAYDLHELDGFIEVRFAAANESLKLLDEREVSLDDDVLVIADRSGAIGLAGIMGGASTAVGPRSVDVFLEAAFFSPSSIAGRARRFGLHTEASMRFERGVDPAQQIAAMERATALLLEISGGEAGPLVAAEVAENLPQRKPIELARDRLQSVLGMPLADAQVEEVFGRLQMAVERQASGWRVTPPSYRFDLEIEEDLIEEVGRIAGYDQLPATPGVVTERPGTATEARADEERLTDLLVARGYHEVVTYSFVDPALEELFNPGCAVVELANPISADMSVMRRSLWPGLMSVALRNLSHQHTRFKLFEIGPQFTAGREGVCETAVLAGLATGERWPVQWGAANSEVDFFDVKADLESWFDSTGRSRELRFESAQHPALSRGQTARIRLGESNVGWLGAVHPELQRRLDLKRGAILFALRLDDALDARVPTFEAYSKFPSVRRDIAVVVDEHVSADALVEHASAAAGTLLQRVVIFDVYRGRGVDSRRKSVALGLILQDVYRTLTDADADQAVRSVTRRLERELGATIRT